MERRKGFTLVELMIAITVLAVVSSIGFVSYSNSQKVARDARRKVDLKNIQTAVENYANKYGRYPCGKGDGVGNPWTPMTSSGVYAFIDLANYNANGDQPFWLKDDGCKDITLSGSWDVDVPTGVVHSTPSHSGVLDTTTIRPFNTDFIDKMPVDPLHNDYPYMRIWDDNSYGYSYWSPDPNYNLDWNNHHWPVGQTYVIWAKLENANDPDSCQNRHYKTCEGQDICSYSSPQLMVIVGCGINP